MQHLAHLVAYEYYAFPFGGKLTDYLEKAFHLNIRKGPGTNYASRGYTGPGIFTIVEEADGQGATRWGLLKGYQSNRSGWISLDFMDKV